MEYTGDPAGDAFVRDMNKADERSAHDAKCVMYGLLLPIALAVVGGMAAIAYSQIKELVERVLTLL